MQTVKVTVSNVNTIRHEDVVADLATLPTIVSVSVGPVDANSLLLTMTCTGNTPADGFDTLRDISQVTNAAGWITESTSVDPIREGT